MAALLAACGGAQQPAAAGIETSIDTAGGVVRVGNAGTPPAWCAERPLRLGSREGGPEEFGRIHSLLADADGNVYVADAIAQEIRVFAPDGRRLRTIGRKGSGPGEFAGLNGLAWLDGGRLAAMDANNWEVFDSEGRLVGAFPAPPRDVTVAPYVRGGRLYQVEADELGVQYVAVYRIDGVRT